MRISLSLSLLLSIKLAVIFSDADRGRETNKKRGHLNTYSLLFSVFIIVFTIFRPPWVLLRYVDEFTRTAGRPEFRGKDESDAIIGNPIQAFQLIKRLTVDWNDLQKEVDKDAWQSKCPWPKLVANSV